MSYRIVDVECIRRAKTTQLNLTGMVYIYILWHPSCARRRPGTVTAVPSYGPHWRGCRPGPLLAGTFTRVPGGVFVGHRPPRDPGGPLQVRSFTSIQMVHTHAPQQRGRWDDDDNEVKVKMRWKLLNQDAKRGTQEKREGANTNTTHLARNGQKPWKGKGKEKERRVDGHATRPAEEGEDGSAWTNLNKARPKPTSARAGPNRPEGRRTQKHMKRGPMGN